MGVDIGGTFTDVVWRSEDGQSHILKLPTTPAAPSLAVIQALERLIGSGGVRAEDIERFVHGTTIATNAVLERKGARTGVITTHGFRDVLEIGRQWRQSMYAVELKPETPVFLAPRARRKEVPERVSASGEIVTPLDEDAVLRVAEELVADGVEAVAICFLFSFLNPAHELRAREIIRSAHPEVVISLSCKVDPAFREYERTAATAFDAYIKPVVDRYLMCLESKLERRGVTAPLQIMHSRGGITAATIARQKPVRLFLSGPAAGVIGGQSVALVAERRNVITVDIGGTSCDIALVGDGKALLRPEGTIAGYPVRVAMVDVNTIGSGGGSLAWLDGAGGLRVGPESAGSDPGPACYGRGGERPTVTDASVVLGYIDPDYFAGGELSLDAERARDAVRRHVADPMGSTVEAAALGIHRVLNAQMAEGIRLVSIRQGYDPRNFALIPFGGAGPLHATALARELGIAEIIVPPHPGVLSAAGLLAAPVEHEASAAFPHALDQVSLIEIQRVLDELDRRCAELMDREGVANGSRRIEHFADMSYAGQSFFLETPLDLSQAAPLETLRSAFMTTHDRVHGHSTEAPMRIVNLRSIHRSKAEMTTAAAQREARGGASGGRLPTKREVLFAGYKERLATDVLNRAILARGDVFMGPAVVEQADTTILIEPDWRGSIGDGGNLHITRDDS